MEVIDAYSTLASNESRSARNGCERYVGVPAEAYAGTCLGSFASFAATIGGDFTISMLPLK
jgi:hypothetical protein